MTQNDVELIQRILQGDQDAFAVLVNKYQKGIHALAWRKIGDFHIAQEITQDTFLKAYENLGDLKSYNSFGGWLYVIAARLCYDWRRRTLCRWNLWIILMQVRWITCHILDM